MIEAVQERSWTIVKNNYFNKQLWFTISTNVPRNLGHCWSDTRTQDPDNMAIIMIYNQPDNKLNNTKYVDLDNGNTLLSST